MFEVIYVFQYFICCKVGDKKDAVWKFLHVFLKGEQKIS